MMTCPSLNARMEPKTFSPTSGALEPLFTTGWAGVGTGALRHLNRGQQGNCVMLFPENQCALGESTCKASDVHPFEQRA